MKIKSIVSKIKTRIEAIERELPNIIDPLVNDDLASSYKATIEAERDFLMNILIDLNKFTADMNSIAIEFHHANQKLIEAQQ